MPLAAIDVAADIGKFLGYSAAAGIDRNLDDGMSSTGDTVVAPGSNG